MSEEGHQAAYLLAQAKSGLTQYQTLLGVPGTSAKCQKGDKLL
jgi:hypothetical protein